MTPASPPPVQDSIPARLRLAYARLSVVYKLALAFWLVLIAGMLALTLQVASQQRQQLDRQAQSLGDIIVRQFANSLTEPLFTDDQMIMEMQSLQLVRDPRIHGVRVFDSEGRALVRAGRASGAETGSDSDIDWLAPEPRVLSAAVVFDGVEGGRVDIEFLPLELQRNYSWMLQTLVWVTLLTTAVLMLLAYAISRRLARPVRTLVAATERIGHGDYTVQLPSQRQDELGTLIRAINMMARGLAHKRQVEALLNQVVASDVADTLLSQLDAPEEPGSARCATVLFVDIVGFTSFSERRPAAEVVALLNEYFSYFTLCSQLFFGCVDKFIGDCAMIVFGAPRPSDSHPLQALACGLAIQRLLQELRRQRPQQELPEVRIGINTGEVMAGTVGSPRRLEYTVVGDTVNLASRLTALARPGAILAGETTINHPAARGQVQYRSLGALTVRGKVDTTHAVEVNGIGGDYARRIDNLIDDIVT